MSSNFDAVIDVLAAQMRDQRDTVKFYQERAALIEKAARAYAEFTRHGYNCQPFAGCTCGYEQLSKLLGLDL